MNLTSKHLKKVALKLGYRVKEGKKHLLVYSDSGLVTTVPRGRIKPGTLAATEPNGDKQGRSDQPAVITCDTIGSILRQCSGVSACSGSHHAGEDHVELFSGRIPAYPGSNHHLSAGGSH